MLDVIEKTVVKFLHIKIFMNYKSSHELLSDNNTNFLSKMIAYYLWKLQICHHIITLYHSQINEKIKNLNSILNIMLMKYLMSKSI